MPAELEDTMTAEHDPEHGIVSLIVRDLTGREYTVSVPFPDDGNIDAELIKLRGALSVLTGRSHAVDVDDYDEAEDGDAHA